MTARPIPSLLATLLERLEGREALDLEFKSARGSLPKDLWPTVSAFANTRGGWIVLGVREREGELELEGVRDALALLQTFHDLVRNPQKISYPVCGAYDASIESLGDNTQVLVFRIPAAPRKQRPVYINGNPYLGTYVRRHTGDYHCTKAEVDRMMREASDVSADSTVLPHFTLDDLDRDTLLRYRRRYQTLNPSSPWNGYDDQRFLQAIGGLARDRERGREGITVAGLLMFGTPEPLREWRSRHLIDYRRLSDDADSESRWEDRVAWEGNLLGAFEAIYPRLIEGRPVPFRLEGGTRMAEGPAHVALREALVNLLVHADYAETQASLIIRSPDGYQLRNPGSSRVPESDLLTGDRSDPRNPELVKMFRLIGLAEEAGTGIPKIIRAWRELGFRLPAIDVGTERYEFTLSLRHAHLLSEEDRGWLRSLGDRWTEAEQLALVLARHEGEVDNVSLRRLTGQHPADVTKVLGSLRDRGLLQMIGLGRGAWYQLGPSAGSAGATATAAMKGTAASLEGRAASLGGSGPSLEGRRPSLEGEQVDLAEIWTELLEIAAPVRAERRVSLHTRDALVVSLCARAPLTIRELAELLGRNEAYVGDVVRSLVVAGRLGFVYAERPRHPKQRYRAVNPPSPAR